MLEIGPSAVSQYLSGKRGYRIGFENEVKVAIEHLARDLMDEKKINLVRRICDICRQLREGEENRCGGSPGQSCAS
jgi:predicted transcriptional regulator